MIWLDWSFLHFYTIGSEIGNVLTNLIKNFPTTYTDENLKNIDINIKLLKEIITSNQKSSSHESCEVETNKVPW